MVFIVLILPLPLNGLKFLPETSQLFLEPRRLVEIMLLPFAGLGFQTIVLLEEHFSREPMGQIALSEASLVLPHRLRVRLFDLEQHLDPLKNVIRLPVVAVASSNFRTVRFLHETVCQLRLCGVKVSQLATLLDTKMPPGERQLRKAIL